jgi:hypothetical protein
MSMAKSFAVLLLFSIGLLAQAPGKLTVEQSKDIEIVRLSARLTEREAELLAAHKEIDKLRERIVVSEICAANKIELERCQVDAQSGTVSSKPAQPPTPTPPVPVLPKEQ